MRHAIRALGVGLPSMLLPLALILVGAVYAVSLRGFFILHPVRAMRGMLGKRKKEALRALSMALAGTLGVGNIAGVALAIAVGGAGSVFWMWVSAAFAMFLKYGEIVLALLFRGKNGDGGAMYYMRDGVGGALGAMLASLFAVLCLFCALTLGSSVQASAAAESLKTLGTPALLSGVLLAGFAALVVFGGARRIQNITEKLIPLLTLFYIFLSLYACIKNARALPSVLSRIFLDAFSPVSALAGGGAFFSVKAMRYGAMRGLLSNEAGAGTAPLAHATAKNTPISQGLLGVIEVFIDTFVLCSATAFVVLLAFEAPPSDAGGVTLVLDAFALLVGRWTRVPIIFSVVLFAYATVICWCFYGERALAYLSPRPIWRRVYLLLFLMLIAAGSVFSSAFVWRITDLSLSLMTLANLFALLLLFPLVKKETGKAFFTKKKKSEKSQKGEAP